MKKLPILVVLLSMLACRFPPFAQRDTPVEQAPPAEAASAETNSAPETDIPPEPTAAPSRAALMDRSCSENSNETWCLMENGMTYAVAPPPGDPQLYDFAPDTKLVLYGSAFPDHGAGPGNKAVTDLWIYDLSTGNAHQMVTEELVIRARFSSNGMDFAYVRAAPETYELVWNSSGSEKVLATDAHFVFEISNNGDRVAFTREPDMGLGPGMGLYAVDVQTGEEQFISEINREGGGSIDDSPIWSPDDRIILLPMIPENDPITTLVAATDGSGSSNLSYDPNVDSELRTYPLFTSLLWHPDGIHLIAPASSGDMLMGNGRHLIVQYTFNPDQAAITDAVILAENTHIIGWETPGSAFWATSHGGNSLTPFLIQLP